ncbi:hypothetical protein K438DRAFT_1963444 [Mycena galopus ATCC 62051]|nr:hypothetical protein K438DRAFT_1963444 [Mycena galopus ATCC 62051]
MRLHANDATRRLALFAFPEESARIPVSLLPIASKMLITRCARRRIPLRLNPTARIYSRPKSTVTQIARKVGADLSSPRKLGVFPPCTPPISLTPEQTAAMNATMKGAVRAYNRAVCRARVVFYHEPCSSVSEANLALLEAMHSNTPGHLAPFRFTLDVRAELPSAETFQDLLYHSGGTSLNIFISPEFQRHHIPNTDALLELLSKDPLLLDAPIVLYENEDNVGRSDVRWLHGPKAVPDLVRSLDAMRTKALGSAGSQVLNRLAKAVNWNRKPGKTGNVKGLRFDR